MNLPGTNPMHLNFFSPKKIISILFANILFFVVAASLHAYPINFVDGNGEKIVVAEKPQRVVSLVPAVTEMLFAIGADDVLQGITYHSTYPAGTADKEIVGGFFSPSMERIKSLQPDLIFVADLHKEVRKQFTNKNCKLVQLNASSIGDIHRNILLLGRLFAKEAAASELVKKSEAKLELVRQKIDTIPVNKRKKVLRIMSKEKPMVPGDDSFQNDFIRAAGGIPPELGKNGNIVSISMDEWLNFNPQALYRCGDGDINDETFYQQANWKDVDAVKDNTIFSFPCDLTCRASVRSADFVQQLAASIYHEEFSEAKNQVLNNSISNTKSLVLPLDYVKGASIVTANYRDFANKTLIVDLSSPQDILSTLEGYRQGVTTVGNHYTPPPLWKIAFTNGLPELQKDICKTLNRPASTSALLFTGADMDNLFLQMREFKQMQVYALVTAGVKSNAVRTGRDEGRFYEPGTINIIIMSNMHLSKRAMTRAMITVTEAKTAALSDLDIRSTYTPAKNQATGTGTDNIIVVGGIGREIDNAGGHSKMGELIARAVYDGVFEAIKKQNGLVAKRNIFQRLAERKINLTQLFNANSCTESIAKQSMIADLEEILLQKRYSAFVEGALMMSDAYEKGLIEDLSAFDSQCLSVAEEISGHEITELQNCIASAQELPLFIAKALNGIYNGIIRTNGNVK
jgi:ABC-type Fe3+-hydroxamate transport system substrate-binding protein/adenosylcobinamide amidohydrolase